MNTLRVVLIASVVALAAACSSTPSKDAAPVAKAAPVAPTLSGNWIVTIESQMGSQDSKLMLTQTGQDLVGSLDAPPPVGTAAIKGNVSGGDVKMSFNVNAQGMDLTIDLIGTQENGSAMKGRAVFGTFGEGTFTAKKNP